jgi:antitoxin VapB
MALNIKNHEVEELAAQVARLAGETKTEAIRRALLERKQKLELRAERLGRGARALTYLQNEVWPLLPADQRGRTLTKDEEEALLGLGPDGV